MMLLTTRCFLPLRAIALVAAFAGAAQAWAADAELVLTQGPQFTITSKDVEADALSRMPPEMQALVLGRPQTVAQIASNLYIRRAWASQAEAEGLDKDPQVVAMLRIARDKVLADAMVGHIERKSVPADAAVLDAAQAIYKAKPERFKLDEQVHVRHILIAGTTPEARAQAEKLLADLKGGADFAALAKAHSADKGNAEKGGDLGFFGKGRMVAAFEEAAFALQNKGDLSGVVPTQFGFHLIQLQDRRPARMQTFDEVKDALLAEVRQSAIEGARIASAQALQKTANVDGTAIEAFSARYAEAAAKAAQSVGNKPAAASK